jgi:hypothetical protein
MDAEALAVSKISSMIATCPYLKAFIATNDKTPFTDGYIDVYGGIRQSKAEWKGRVPIQVKGRTRRSKKRSMASHPVARTDLLAYQNDSGVLFLVVAIEPNTHRCTPYYALLSPFAIESILNRAPKDKAQIPVPLKMLPEDSASIERVVALALKTREQNMSLGFDPVLFERASSLTVHTASDLDFNIPVTLTPGMSDFALVLNTTDGLSLPLAGELRIFPPDYMKRKLDLQIRSGKIAYDGAVVQRIDEELFEAVISEGLTLSIRITPGGQSTNVTVTLEPTLVDRLKAIEFYFALLDTQVIEINGKPSPIEITRSDETGELREHLNSLRALKELFDHLGVDARLINVDEIDAKQTRQLNVIHRAFVQNEEISDASAETSRVVQPVGQWRLMFLVSPGSAPDKWQFIDPFAIDFRQQFRWSSEDEMGDEAIPVTAYDVVDGEHLATVLNMRLDSIVGAYEAISDFPSTYGVANQRVVALIGAADASSARKDELLDAATHLNDWLIEEEGDEPQHLINRWQIASRRGGLSAEQRSEIRGLKREFAKRSGMERADQFELACAILLGDDEEVEDLFQQLPEERRQQMQSWPIWELRNRTD